MTLGKIICTMRRCFCHTDLGQNAVFTILQDKLHIFSLQDDRGTHILCRTNYTIDHITKRFKGGEIHNVGTVQSELSAPTCYAG